MTSPTTSSTTSSTASSTPTDTGSPAVSAPPGAPRGSRPLLLAVLVGALVVGALLSFALGPRTPHLGEASSGDAQLVADVRASMTTDRGYQALSVARVRDGRVTYAGLGTAASQVPTPQTPFEMGSITKTITGDLLADAVRRHEMRLDAPVATYLPELDGTPAGSATLVELATHTAGLPEFPPAVTLRSALRGYANDNPYGAVSVSELLAATRKTPVKDRGAYRYSNLGMSLLGHAEARAAKAADWPTLATERVLRPLGMNATHFAMTAADVPDSPATPRRDNGWPTANWYGPAFAPAGSSTWTTAADLASYAQALLDRRAPGLAALEPRTQAGTNRIGLAWHLRTRLGREITWHNGATGGFRSMLALDRGRGQAVIVLGDTTRWTDQIGINLAATPAGQPLAAVDHPRWPAIGALLATLIGVLSLATFAWQALRGADRLSVANGLLSGVAGVLILLAHGPWSLVPAWVWGSLTGLSSVVAVLGLGRARHLPAVPARRPILAWLSLVTTALVLAVAVWTL